MNLLCIQNVGKAFRSYKSDWHRIARWFGVPVQASEEHWVLRHINFSIIPGEIVGIIGQNGAGKSTLLKIIAGTLQASEGKVLKNTRIAALLELGMGFNPELTGRQNALHASGLMGLNADQIHQKMPEIEAFSEIGDAFDAPLRTYSSGMQMRVAFSVAIAHSPELLIIDEALSVGDAYFQQKCMKKIFALKQKGVSILFVSHDMNAVKMLCDSAIIINDGLMLDQGNTQEMVNFYQNMILIKSHQGDLLFKQKKLRVQQKQNKISSINHAATGEVQLLDFSLRDENNNETNYIISEKILKIDFTIQTSKALDDPHFGIMLRNKYGLSAFETNTFTMRQATEPLKQNEIITIEFSFECNLGPEDYSISIGVANRGYDRDAFEEYLLFLQDIDLIKVIENSHSILYSGCTNLKPKFIRKHSGKNEK